MHIRRMTGMISKELEDEMDAANSNKIWQPAIDLPLSPELKASMLVAVEEAEKEGKQISTQEAERIALASTTTKSWGIKFPIQWIHVYVIKEHQLFPDPEMADQILTPGSFFICYI